MSRLPLNLRSFGIAGLGALGTKPTIPIYPDADGRCPAGYYLANPGSKSAQCYKTPTNTITPYNISPSIKLSNPETTTANTIGFKPPGAPGQASVPMQAVQAQVSTPLTAEPIRWIPIALGGVSVLGLLYLLMRRR